jgi:hypothetical protein
MKPSLSMSPPPHIERTNYKTEIVVVIVYFILCRVFIVSVILCTVFRLIFVLFFDVCCLCVVSYCSTTATG